MGESNCSWNRQLNLSKDLLISAQSIYKGRIAFAIDRKIRYELIENLFGIEMYGNEDSSIPATYQVLYFIAWKPDESQVRHF